MTAKLVAFDIDSPDIVTLKLDSPLSGADIGDIWIAHAEKDRCVWAQDLEGNYNTGCERFLCGMEDGGSMAEHNMPFCPCCGRLIETNPYVENQEEE